MIERVCECIKSQFVPKTHLLALALVPAPAPVLALVPVLAPSAFRP